MATIRQKAAEYESKQTKNISDLQKVNVNVDIEEKTFTTEEGKDFVVNIANIEGDDYRVPASVLKQLKAIIAAKPGMTVFKVIKSGEGMGTSYQVIPLD